MLPQTRASPEAAPPASESYLAMQKAGWETGYHAPNVESTVFRFYGRVLKPEFGMTGERGERLLDFGCGQAAAVAYFHRLGFESYGVDISETDIGIARQRLPDIAARLTVTDPRPHPGKIFAGAPFDCIISMQTLYYLNDMDLSAILHCFHVNLRPGGVLYASMMSFRHHHFQHAGPRDEDGMRQVVYDNPRAGHREFAINFVRDEADMIERFAPLFRPLHIGHYAEKLRSDEAERHHLTFIGIRA